MTQAQDIMTANPITCKERDSIINAAEVMKKKNVGVVPIVDDYNRCRGIVTDRDLSMRILAERRDPSTHLQKIMSTNLVTCSPEDDLSKVLRDMEGQQVKRVIVVNNKQECVGIISEADIIQRMKEPNKVMELVENVYR
jgi:CBS domain-containing protein